MQNERLTVIQLINNLDVGGAQEVVRTLASYLPASGARVVVGTFRDGPLRTEIERLGVPVEVLPQRRYTVVALPLFLVDMLRIRRSLQALVRRHQADVVQTHLLRLLDFLVLTLRLRSGRPLVFWTVHNYNFALRKEQLSSYAWLLRPKRLAYRWMYRMAARWVNGVIAVSDEVRTAILHTIGPIGDKVTIICNGVDSERYHQAADRVAGRQQLGLTPESRLVITVGTLKEQKGHRYLIDAAAAVIEHLPEVHFILIGDGPLRSALQNHVRARGLASRVHFLGERHDVAALLAISDMFVLPSLWEGLPMALIEAMAAGLPIVATNVSGTKQVMIAGETGLIVPPGNVAALAAAIIELLSDPIRAVAMGAAAHHRVERFFSARIQAERHMALFRQAAPVT